MNSIQKTQICNVNDETIDYYQSLQLIAKSEDIKKSNHIEGENKGDDEQNVYI